MSEPQIRPLTMEVYRALRLDRWPTPAGIVDFGLTSDRHYEALRWAVTREGVAPEQLDAALGKSAELQALISPANPHRDVVFRTLYDDLTPEPPAGDEPTRSSSGQHREATQQRPLRPKISF